MTVNSDNDKDQYWGDGVTAAFDVTIEFINASELLVTILDVDGITEIPRTLGSHYNVTGGGGSTGQIIFTGGNIPTGSGAPGSQKVTITRDMPFTQVADLTPNDPLPSNTLEISFGDRLMMIAQQLRESISRTVKLKISSGHAPIEIIEDPIAGCVPIYNDDGDIINGPDAADISGAQGYAATAVAAKNDAVTAKTGAELARDQALATANGMKFRGARLASVANINISSAPSFVDGVAPNSLDRLLLKNQSTAAENGCYQFNGVGNPLTRTTDMDAWTEIVGSLVVVEEGAVNADLTFLCTSNQGGTLGSTAITFITWQAFIAAASVANSMLANMAANTIKMNAGGIAGAPQDVTVFTNTLIGRGSSGNISGITLGTNLSFAGTVLNAATATLTPMAIRSPTSGTSDTQTGIPSGVNIVLISFLEIYKPGTDDMLLQIGPSGGVDTTGYKGAGWRNGSTNASAVGIYLNGSWNAIGKASGNILLTRIGNTNKWAWQGNVYGDGGYMILTGGAITLSGVLERVLLGGTGGSPGAFVSGDWQVSYGT